MLTGTLGSEKIYESVLNFQFLQWKIIISFLKSIYLYSKLQVEDIITQKFEG